MNLLIKIFKQIIPSRTKTIAFSLLSTVVQSGNTALPDSPKVVEPKIFQVVGLQWLNPLQRKDYPTEWQLLWTLGKAMPNHDDEMAKNNPKKYSAINSVTAIAVSNGETDFFNSFIGSYILTLLSRFHGRYFGDSRYFYNVHSLENKTTWRELAGIHVEYAVPATRITAAAAHDYLKQTMQQIFAMGNPSMPTTWTRDSPPDIHVTQGGASAGFQSLEKAMAYLQSHPNETAWVMNADAPSYPLDEQINENMVLLVLAGPNYKTGRAPLAWIGPPAVEPLERYEAKDDLPSREVQAWTSAFKQAAIHSGKKISDIGYIIHDANTVHPASSERIRPLAQTIATELQGLDFTKQTFNTPALLGEMGAGTALTNVALAIAHANHFGDSVLVAGTTEPDKLTAVVVAPPAKVRPIKPDEPWFRARSGKYAYLMWWGLRDDAPQDYSQGFSQ
ncbi:hypothetical protein ACLB1G_03505 [Oxalobacteraceae bacterium A2-2]